MWIAIVVDISQRAYQGWGSLSKWIYIWSSGYPRNNQQLKRHFLVQSLWQWITKWKHSEACSTSWGLWYFRFLGLHTYMGKICQLSTILSVRILLWVKRVTRFFIVRLGRALRWGSHWRIIFEQMTILRIWWQNSSQVRRDETTLAKSCIISIMDTTRIETGYFWLTILITVTGDSTSQLRGLKVMVVKY